MSKLDPKYKVYFTNADFDEVEFFGEYVSRDLADSYCFREFQNRGCLEDMMVVCSGTHEILGMLLSAKTARLRGECQG